VMMAFAVQQRRGTSALAFVRSWSECAGGPFDAEADALADVEWWRAYDAHYSLSGWDYRVVQVKARARAAA
jgi:hypothetical protein